MCRHRACARAWACRYGAQVDVWSMGVILFILLCGYPPFNHRNHAALITAIKDARYSFDEGWEHVSDAVKDLISRILVADPAVRLTTTELLAHPWVTGEVAAGATPLTGALVGIRRFNARKRVRGAGRLGGWVGGCALVACAGRYAGRCAAWEGRCVGVWGCGGVGVWMCGGVGVWVYGCVGVRTRWLCAPVQRPAFSLGRLCRCAHASSLPPSPPPIL